MRKWIALMLMGVLLLAGMTVTAEEEKQSVKVVGFVYDKCGNCGVTATQPGCGECTIYLDLFARVRIELLELTEAGDVTFEVNNIQQGYARPTYYAYCDAFGVTEEDRNQFPQFFIGAPENGVFLMGDESVGTLAEVVQEYSDGLQPGERTEYPAEEVEEAASKLDIAGNSIDEGETNAEATEAPAEAEEDFYRNDDLSDVGENDTKIVYVYKPNCEFCAKVKPLLEGLPDTITLPDGSSSRVVFTSLNKDDYDQYQIVKRYYEMLGIPEDHRYSPLLIVGDKYYMGYDEIVPNLLNALMAGDGVNTDLTPVME